MRGLQEVGAKWGSLICISFTERPISRFVQNLMFGSVRLGWVGLGLVKVGLR